MSYLSWRAENEDKWLPIINDGEVIPCMEISSKEEFSGEIIPHIVKKITSNPLVNGISFPVLFAQYLYETYHVSPVDIELFLQTSFAICIPDYYDSAMFGNQNGEQKEMIDDG